MKRMTLSVALAAVTMLAACGNDNQSAGDTTLAASVDAPSTTQLDGAPPATSALPAANRIVSLSPTATEMLFAIGAGDQVVAVDDRSNYPPEVLDKPHDLSGVDPDVEAIAALTPDLVVIADDDNGISQQLEAAGLTVWSGPVATSIDNIYEQIEQLGAATGHSPEAAALVTEMQTDIDAAVASAPQPSEPMTYYHELDDTFRSVTQNSFIGQVYSLFGLRSIADFEEVDSDYPQLSSDVVIAADPDFMFIAGQSPETVAARPGWGSLKAVTNGNVVMVDADTSSRWGPRIVEFVAAVSAAM